MRNFLLLSFCVFISCSTPGEKELTANLLALDEVLRRPVVEYKKIESDLLSINKSLMHEEYKVFNNGAWETLARFKWNQDSSIVMVSSWKKHKDGFKREIILNVKDSILFVKRLDALTENNDQAGFDTFEELLYLTRGNRVKAVVRRLYPSSLKDTVELRGMPFTNIENRDDMYSFEMEYLKRIMNRN